MAVRLNACKMVKMVVLRELLADVVMVTGRENLVLAGVHESRQAVVDSNEIQANAWWVSMVYLVGGSCALSMVVSLSSGSFCLLVQQTWSF